MPKIPEYQSNVEPTVARIPTQETPLAPREAFGEDAARASASFATKVIDPVAKLFSDRATERLKIDNATHAANVKSMYMDNVNKRLYSDEIETYKDANGVKQERLSGTMMRMKNKADNSSYELNDGLDSDISTAASMINDPEEKAQFLNFAYNDKQSKMSGQFKHEVAQRRAFAIDSQMSNIDNQVQDAVSIQNDADLIKRLDNMDIESAKFSKIDDQNYDQAKATGQANREKLLGMHLTALTSQGKFDEANRVIDVVGDRVDAKTMKTLVENERKENTVNLENDFHNRIKDEGISPKLVSDIEASRDVLGQAKTDEVLGKVKKIQNARAASLYDADNFSEEQQKLIGKAKNAIEGFVNNPVDNFQLNQQLIDLMGDGLNKEETKEIESLYDRITGQGKKEDKSQWQSIMGQALDFFGTIPVHADIKFIEHMIKLATAKDAEAANEENMRQEYNKAYPQVPLSKDEKVLDPTRERETISAPFMEKLTKGGVVGFGTSVKGFGKSIDLLGESGSFNTTVFVSPLANIKVGGKNLAEHLGEGIERIGNSITDSVDISPQDQDFIFKLGAGAGSSAFFLLPGFGIARGVKLVTAAPRLARWLGSTASAVIESSVIAGTSYEEAITRGMPDNKAQDIAAKAFWTNIPATAITNSFGVFGQGGKGFIGILKSSGNEGFQEFTQEIIGNMIFNDPILQDAFESAAIGSIVGGGVTVTENTVGWFKGLDETKKIVEKLSSERGSIILPFGEGGKQGEIVTDINGEPVKINPSIDVTGGEVVEVKPEEAIKEVKKVEEGKQSQPVKKTVRESTNQIKDSKKLYTERQALRQSLKSQARAANESSLATKDYLKNLRKEIIEPMKLFLPKEEHSKFITMISNASKPKDVIKALSRIDSAVEKEHKKSLIEDIKKISSSVDKSEQIAVDYDTKIKELVGEIDLKKRTQEKLTKINETIKFIEEASKRGEDVTLPRRIINEIELFNKRDIDEVSNAELQNLFDDVELLEKLGKTKQRAREETVLLLKEKDLANITADSVPINSQQVDRLLPGEEQTMLQRVNNLYKRKRSGASLFDLNISPMDVVFDMLDGSKNYLGANYRTFKKRIDGSYSSYLDMKDSFQLGISLLADKLSLTQDDFDTIGMYAAREQEGGEDKLLASGFIQKQIDGIELSDNQLEFYLEMRSKLDEMRPFVEETMRVVHNQPLGEVDNYFTFMTDFDAMSTEEIKEMFGGKVKEYHHARKNVEKGFTIDRVLGKQKIKINAMEIYMKHIDNAAYLVKVGADIKYLGELAKTENYQKAVGNIGQSVVVNWIDVLARKGGTGEQKIKWIDNLRSNVGAATLGFKLSSILIQPSSIMNGGALIGKDAFTGFYDVISNRETREFVYKNFAEIRHRIGDDPAFMDYNDSVIPSKLKRLSYKPLRYLDGLTASGVAIGAYKKYLNDNNIPFDIKNVDKEAMQEAQRIVRRTQASGVFKDMPAVFLRGETLASNSSINKAILQFQSFLFNNWSLYRHDFYNLGIKERDVGKAVNIAVFMALANFAEIGLRNLSKSAIDFLVDGEFDDDKEENDTLKQFAINLVQSIPFVGQAVSVFEYGSVPVPIGNAFVRIGDNISALKKSKKKKTIQKNLLRLLTSLATPFGVPGSSQTDQLIKEANESGKTTANPFGGSGFGGGNPFN